MTAATLHLLPFPEPAPNAHPLLALCAGEPVLLTESDADLIAFVNAGTRVLDPAVDPDTATAATTQLAWFVHHVGDTHATDGDRAQNLASHLRRYVLPFLLELTHHKPADRRGVADLRYMEAEQLTRILAGKAPLPAATVAGDLLGRAATTARWLTLLDAGTVSHGGAPAVQEAVARRQVPVHRDGLGHRLVASADLRAAGMLIEPSDPHGLTKGSAGNVLFGLKHAIARAQNSGAAVRGNFAALRAIQPLLMHRLHDPRIDSGYLDLATIRGVAAQLHVVHQTVLWLLRLMGLRIGEAYGLLVADLQQTDDGLWSLQIEKQGGRKATVRDPYDGTLRQQDNKPTPKTPQSERIIGVPGPLVDLLLQIIAIFHTDDDGTVRMDARLIPGVRKDDVSGMGGFSNALENAIGRSGCPSFVPHDLRGHLITDLENAKVDERLGEYYTGHRDDISNKQKTVHEEYDDGVPLALQVPAVAAVEALILGLAVDSLIAETHAVESFGVNTRAGLRRQEIAAQIQAKGWTATPTGFEPGTVTLNAVEVAARLDLSPTEVRRRFEKGEMPARKVPRGNRSVWKLDERDLGAAQTDTLTLVQLAEEIGKTYHQTRALCLSLGVLRRDAQRKGAAVHLTHAEVAIVRAELDRRRDAATQVVDLTAAARTLGLPLGQIEKLWRSGDLQAAPDPAMTRRRHVTRASVDAYAEAHGVKPSDHDDLFVPFGVACAALRLSRQAMSTAAGVGQFRSIEIARRMHISLADALAYAQRGGLGQDTSARLTSAAVPAHRAR